MNITSCGGCLGRGHIEQADRSNWGDSYHKSVCLQCEGRGCDPIPSGETGQCPSCRETILVGSVAPKGACHFCGIQLALLPPKCVLTAWETRSHTLIHDNAIGAGVSIDLGNVAWKSRGPCIILAKHRGRILFPGDGLSIAKVVNPGGHGSFAIELGRVENQDGKIVETIISRVEVAVSEARPAS